MTHTPGAGRRIAVRPFFRTREDTIAIPSTRTPEGQPGQCPVCGAEFAALPADPLGDAPCPACGTLLWPLPAESGVFLFAGEQLNAEKRAKLREIAQRFDRGDLDSLERVEALMEIEEAFELSIPDAVAEGFETVSDLIVWLRRQSEGTA